MLREKYDSADKRISKQFVRAFEDGKDWRVVAKHDGVNYQTVYHQIHADELRYERLPRSETQSKSLDYMETDQIVTWLEEDPTVTLELLQARVKAEFDKNVSHTTIGNHLDCRLITLKNFHLIPFGMKNSNTKERRKYSVLKMFKLDRLEDCIYWTDERNLDLFFPRTMEQCTEDTRSCLQICYNRGRSRI
ncbi:hypothetical protein FBUS_08094 [Fasciolopsis buskii]|uniref:Uncharacterized protein n=1 Tax=Fasciolopsis buskii TaxID=27845 RepID=A0A8E0VQX2_9TREM|nr:hypothetical protein FBUS_08094 [Fasciolopsis buski]